MPPIMQATRHSILLPRQWAMPLALVLLLAAVPGAALRAADAAAGAQQFRADCASCHEASDWQGDAASEVADALRRISAGQLSHRKAMQLSERQIADLAAYMVAGAP